MTNKKLTILGIIAAVLVVLVIIQSRLQDTATPRTDTVRYLVQGLDPARIAAVELIAGDEKINLTKRNGQFTIEQLSGYPARISQINELITNCLDIRVGRVYTSEPRNFDELGVSEDTARYVVRFKDSGGELITGIIASEFKDGRLFVRRVDSNSVYTSDQPLWLDTSPKSYARQQITEINTDEIKRVTVSSGDYEYTIISDGGTPVLQDVPEGKEPKNSEVRSVFRAAARIRFEDVKRKADVGELSFDRSFVCELENSTVYTISIAKSDDKTYAVFEAEFTDQTPVTISRTAAESEEELRKKEAKLLANEAAQKFKETHSGWVYELSSTAANNLTKPLESLLEDKPQPEPEPETEPEPDPEPEPEPQDYELENDDDNDE